MKLKIFLFTCLLIIGFQQYAAAGEVSPARAKLVAGNFFQESFQVHGFNYDVSNEVQLQSVRKADGRTLYYIFSFRNNTGSVIVSADDRIPPILGYTFSGNFHGTEIPPACSAFMEDMAQQISQALANNGASADRNKVSKDWNHFETKPFHPNRQVSNVEPLITSRWGQGCFFNAGCPNDPAAVNSCLHALAGAGATAMAQIMKFYQYPAHGTGEHGYPHPQYGIQYANFGATNYNWSSMPDSVTAGNDALAMLIYQCGVAQNMNFSAGNSTSTSAEIDSAFVKYFSYPQTAVWKSKQDYTSAEWLTQLKNELDASHPLLYSGYTSTAQFQHYFICDGYQGDDFFHFNWGWGGAYDGYFYLNNLTQDTLNYTFAQQAIFNLAPSNPPPASYIMNFENVPDFSLTFNDWTVNDVDKHDTYLIDQHTFPHNGEPMAFLSFNPALVTPSMAADPAIQPHGGQRFGACFSSNPPRNNDWFISPQIQLGTNGSFSFWIKSYNDTYLVDDYIVAVSTTNNNPGSFIPISGPDTLHTTTAWQKKIFNLGNFNNQKVYVAIQCVSNDHFLMMIDDLEVKPQESSSLVADFTSDKITVRVGETVNFTDMSSGSPTSWNWTFAGGLPATSAQQNPTAIKYSNPGSFPVKLKISNGSTADSVTKTAYIKVSSYPSSMSLDFESLADFTLAFSPWATVDVRGGNTYGIQGVTFTNNYSPMAYICFNPSKTTPALTNMLPHSGQKLGCSFSTTPPLNPNDKWLISPKLSLGIYPQIEFWVKTYNAEFGLERYNVAVSTTDLNPLNFIPLTAAYEEAPVDWTKRTYSLQNYTSQDVYIGIQCITDNGFIFMLDDISITSTVGIDEDNTQGILYVFPNPAKDWINLRLSSSESTVLRIGLINGLGTEVRSWKKVSEAGCIKLDISGIPPGVYILRINNGKSDVMRKVSVID